MDGSVVDGEMMRGVGLSTKGIGFRCKGHLISYFWTGNFVSVCSSIRACASLNGISSASCRCFRGGGGEIPHFFIDKRRHAEDIQVLRVWFRLWYLLEGFMFSVGIFAASERACMNSWRGVSPSSAKMHERNDQVFGMSGWCAVLSLKSVRTRGMKPWLWLKYVIGWIMARCIQGFFGAQKNVYGTEGN